MIEIIILLSGLSFLMIKRSRVHFELVALCLLAVPIEAYLLAKLFIPGAFTYGALILLNVALSLLLTKKSQPRSGYAFLVPCATWIISFICFLSLCHSWPDFMPMGERLRDYALLSGIIRDPFVAQEPWMSGANLNYYLYWYRFGAFLASLFSIREWDMYHILSAFTFSFYLATLVRLFSYRFTTALSIALGTFIALASNVEGVWFFLKSDNNWWGPSRVIKGAINEFPAWSFLLGDLHPHFLSYAITPFVALLLLAIWSSERIPSEKLLTTFFGICLVGPLWIFNSNAWEVPVLVIFLSAIVFICITKWSVKKLILAGSRNFADSLRGSSRFSFISLLFMMSLYLSSRNIAPGETPFRFVSSPIPVTSTLEFFRHFGFPAVLIVISSLSIVTERRIQLVFGLALILCALSQPALPWLIVMLALQLYRVVVFETSKATDIKSIVFESLGLLGIAMVLIPELVFMDDPYGGENERMNTIFKAYCVAWTTLHVYGFYLAGEALKGIKNLRDMNPNVALIPLALIMFVFCGFFAFVTDIRKSDIYTIEPVTRGLSQLDRQYPGAAKSIMTLTDAPLGVVLEAQGNAYSLTSHVSTLSNKPAFLGWQNHVDLLTRDYNESKRRAELTERIYSSMNCDEISAELRGNKINYLVFGPLEREKYPNLQESAFSCLTELVNTQSYRIYTAPNT